MDILQERMAALMGEDVVVPSFPLFNLPPDSVNNVLRNMKLDQLFGFSTLSEKTKNLVKALNLEVISLHVMIGRVIQIEIFFKTPAKLALLFLFENNKDVPIKLVAKIDDPAEKIGKLVGCYVDYFDNQGFPIRRWNNMRFNVREWIDHIQSVLNYPKIDELTLEYEIIRFDIDSLRTTIEGLNVKDLHLPFKVLPNYFDMLMSIFPQLAPLSPFRILNLPSTAQKNIIRNMEPLQQIFISFLSDKTKKLVKSLNLEAYYIRVTIGDWTSLEVMFRGGTRIELTFQVDNNGYLKGLSTYNFSTFDNNGYVADIRTLEKEQFSLRDWIDLHFELFDLPEISLLSLKKTIGEFNIGLIHNSFKGLHVVRLNLLYEGYYEYTKMIMASLKSFDDLIIRGDPFPDIHEILSQNYGCILFSTPRRLTLDDLLICNISTLGMHFNESLSDKDLNRFIKHWINGSNSRMEKIHIQFDESRLLDQNVILNGIDFEILPPEQKRIMKGRKTRLLKKSFVTIYRGGFDIKRNDGTLANIQLKWDEEEQTSTFQLVVWHDFNLI